MIHGTGRRWCARVAVAAMLVGASALAAPLAQAAPSDAAWTAVPLAPTDAAWTAVPLAPTDAHWS